MGGHIWQLRLETGYESVEWADTPRTSLGGLTKMYRLTHIGIFELNWMNYVIWFLYEQHILILDRQTSCWFHKIFHYLLHVQSQQSWFKNFRNQLSPKNPQNIFPQLIKHGVPENVPCLSMSSWFFHSFFPWKARVRGIFPPRFREPLRP